MKQSNLGKKCDKATSKFFIRSTPEADAIYYETMQRIKLVCLLRLATFTLV